MGILNVEDEIVILDSQAKNLEEEISKEVEKNKKLQGISMGYIKDSIESFKELRKAIVKKAIAKKIGNDLNLLDKKDVKFSVALSRSNFDHKAHRVGKLIDAVFTGANGKVSFDGEWSQNRKILIELPVERVVLNDEEFEELYRKAIKIMTSAFEVPANKWASETEKVMGTRLNSVELLELEQLIRDIMVFFKERPVAKIRVSFRIDIKEKEGAVYSDQEEKALIRLEEQLHEHLSDAISNLKWSSQLVHITSN